MRERYRSEPIPIGEALRNLTTKVESQRKVIDKLKSETKKVERLDRLIALTEQVDKWMTELIEVYRYLLKYPHDGSVRAAEMREERAKLTVDIERTLGEIEGHGEASHYIQQMRSKLVSLVELLERESSVYRTRRELQEKGTTARARADSRWFKGRSQ